MLIITRMGPQELYVPNRWGQLTNTTTFHPNLAVEGARMVPAFAVGCTLLLLLIRFRLPPDAAKWKRHSAIYVSYALAGFSYFLMFVYAGAGAGYGWLVYGVFLLILAVSLVSLGRYGYDFEKY